MMFNEVLAKKSVIRKMLVVFSFLIMLTLFLSSTYYEDNSASPGKSSDQKNIVLVYGTESCGLTQAFIGKLKKEKINYKLIDIDNDDNSNEMWQKLFKIHPNGGSVTLPVVDVNGQIITGANEITAEMRKCCKSSNEKNEVNSVSPDKSSDQKNIILVYGRESCGLTQAFIGKLKKEKINYKLIDIDNDDNSNEMWQKLFKIYPNGGSVTLPVVDVNGQIIPGANEITAEMRKCCIKK